MDGFILNMGPPFNPINFLPISSKFTTMGVSTVIFEFEKMEQ